MPLKTGGFRVEVDDRNEKLGYKIRQGTPGADSLFVSHGAIEKRNRATVAVRERSEGDLGAMTPGNVFWTGSGRNGGQGGRPRINLEERETGI